MKEAFSLRKRISRDTLAHTETIVKKETHVLDRLINEDGTSGILRLFVGATEAMPTRALSYVLAAARLGELLPVQQVQVIGVLSVANRVNGTNIQKSRKQFELLARYGRHMLTQGNLAQPDTVMFATDGNPEVADRYISAVEEAVQSSAELASMFEKKGLKHGGKPIPYIASHIAYQETSELEVLTLMGEPDPIGAEVIVSAGSQQEKPFHTVRTRVRALDIDGLVPSLQIFTKHISAPYFMARGGEQELGDAVSSRQVDFNPTDRHAALDMAHLRMVFGGSHE